MLQTISTYVKSMKTWDAGTIQWKNSTSLVEGEVTVDLAEGLMVRVQAIFFASIKEH